MRKQEITKHVIRIWYRYIFETTSEKKCFKNYILLCNVTYFMEQYRTFLDWQPSEGRITAVRFSFYVRRVGDLEVHTRKNRKPHNTDFHDAVYCVRSVPSRPAKSLVSTPDVRTAFCIIHSRRETEFRISVPVSPPSRDTVANGFRACFLSADPSGRIKTGPAAAETSVTWIR